MLTFLLSSSIQDRIKAQQEAEMTPFLPSSIRLDSSRLDSSPPASIPAISLRPIKRTFKRTRDSIPPARSPGVPKPLTPANSDEANSTCDTTSPDQEEVSNIDILIRGRFGNKHIIVLGTPPRGQSRNDC
ncbi:unnamed protein product [Heligmosomoides polygyrus]|uniref:Kinesin motor domain-containing protein n=1 Tax=Heligmosomoides polygyrus TaxID=6339 RepID=A0A183FQK7_HELPZ|nr:unnamed protein product [Heligmosomoides polygyrus]